MVVLDENDSLERRLADVLRGLEPHTLKDSLILASVILPEHKVRAGDPCPNNGSLIVMEGNIGATRQCPYGSCDQRFSVIGLTLLTERREVFDPTVNPENYMIVIFEAQVGLVERS